MLPVFKLEEFLKKYEFSIPYLLCASDAESWSLSEMLQIADPESKKLWEQMTFGYTEVDGHPLLREEIARLYSQLPADHILTFAGSEEGIYCVMRTLISPGDHVITVSANYQSLQTLPEAFGADVTKISLRSENRWKLQRSDFNGVFRKNTKLVVINYPHNPTGSLLDKEVFEELIALARKNGSYIFCDEMYRFLEIDESKRLPSIADAYEKGIALSGTSKSFGLPGLRIGWLASQNKAVLQKAASYKVYTSISNSAPSEILGIMGLRAKKTLLKRNREIMLGNLKLMDAFFERHKDVFSWVRPESGTNSLVQLLLPISIEEFTDELVKSAGILIMPGSIVDISGNYFRMSFGRKNFPEALSRFEEFIYFFRKKG